MLQESESPKRKYKQLNLLAQASGKCINDGSYLTLYYAKARTVADQHHCG